MKTVNSISGGKTSSYLAINYPADYNLFSLVSVEDRKLTPKDKKLVQIVSDKIGKEFIGTVEKDQTLKCVLDLEQVLGKEIKWLCGKSFEQVIKSHSNYLPNVMSRFCTTEMKIESIANYCKNEIKEIVLMRLGIRYDEENRVDYDNTDFKFHVGYSKNGKRRRFKTEKYRELEYPLVTDKIEHFKIYKWSLNSGINFPNDSNCVGCFHKEVQQLRKNWDDEPLKMQWFADQEEKRRRFKKEMTYQQIKTIGLQQDFNFGGGSSCNSGACHD